MKQRRHFLKETADGKVFFAPLPEWWDIRYAASKRRFGDEAYKHFSRRRLVRELNADLQREGKKPVPWYLVFGDHPARKYAWFLDWLLRGKKEPDNVTIVPPAVLAWAARAWDYPAICREAGISISTYEKQLAKGIIPDLATLKWLFAGPDPADVFIADEPVQKLRFQRSIQRIAAPDAARMSVRTWKEYQKYPELKALLEKAIEAASTSGYHTALDNLPAWKRAGPLKRRSIWNCAKASTMAACSKRAELDQTIWPAKKKEAKRLGVLAALDRYVATEDRTQSHDQAGMRAENFYAPAPAMFPFRAVTRARGTPRPRDLLELEKHPLFDAWFADSVIPRAMRGRRARIIEALFSPIANGQPAPPVEVPGDYIPAREAMAITALSYSRLSKLCRPGGPVRYQRPAGRRLLIHAADLARYMASRAATDP